MKKYEKLYNLVYQMLITWPETRGSDKKLMWFVWEKLGYVVLENLTVQAFVDPMCPTPESITRCRRKIQELHPELQAANRTRRARAEKAQQKGTHIFRERARAQAPLCPGCAVGRLIVHTDYDYSTRVAVVTKTYRKCNNEACGWVTTTV